MLKEWEGRKEGENSDGEVVIDSLKNGDGKYLSALSCCFSIVCKLWQYNGG